MGNIVILPGHTKTVSAAKGHVLLVNQRLPFTINECCGYTVAIIVEYIDQSIHIFDKLSQSICLTLSLIRHFFS